MTLFPLALAPSEASPLPIEFDPSITDWIGAVGGVLLGIGTILVAVLAYRAQRQADAARRESETAQVTALEAQTQAANAQVDAMRFLADALNHSESLAADDHLSNEAESEPEPEPTSAPEPAPTPEREPVPAPGPSEEPPEPPVPSVPPGRPHRGERPERGGGRRHRQSNVQWGASLAGDRGFALTNVGSEPAIDVTVMAQNFGGGGGGRRPPTTHTIAQIAPGETTTVDAAFDPGAFARMLVVRWHEGDGYPHVERIVAA